MIMRWGLNWNRYQAGGAVEDTPQSQIDAAIAESDFEGAETGPERETFKALNMLLQSVIAPGGGLQNTAEQIGMPQNAMTPLIDPFERTTNPAAPGIRGLSQRPRGFSEPIVPSIQDPRLYPTGPKGMKGGGIAFPSNQPPQWPPFNMPTNRMPNSRMPMGGGINTAQTPKVTPAKNLGNPPLNVVANKFRPKRKPPIGVPQPKPYNPFSQQMNTLV